MSRKLFRNRTLSNRRVATLTRATLMALSLVTLNVDVMHTVADPSTLQNGIEQNGASGGRDKTERVHHYGLTSSSGLSPSSSSASSVAGNGSAEKPYFDDINSRNVTTVVDDTAVLKCRVKYKGDRTVSWMRKRDLHILTSNIYTYTGDQRFSVIHPPDSDDWDLKISYAQQKDSGIYECQVNTEPKINLAVYLAVSEERDFVQASGGKHFIGGTAGLAVRAKITGSQEVYVKKGSTISLSCVVNVHASSISWYHGSAVVDFDSARGGISLETEKTEGGTSSRLMLTRATLKDSGNYTCVPTGAIAASVQVHVLNGEHPAAMQTSGAAMVLFCPTRYMLVFILVSLNSCNLSKLIHFISSLFEAARFALASAAVSLLTRIRRPACSRPLIPSISSSSSHSSSSSTCCSSSCNHQSVSSLYHPNISIQSLNRPPTLSQRR